MAFKNYRLSSGFVKNRHRYSVGDVIEVEGARLRVVRLVRTPDKLPAYDLLGKFAHGELWRVSESWLVVKRNGAFK